jgi:hypothetical protein
LVNWQKLPGASKRSDGGYDPSEPKCGTLRNVLPMIRESGDEPEVIKYLKNPPTRHRLKELVKAMEIPVRALLRQKGTRRMPSLASPIRNGPTIKCSTSWSRIRF